MSEWKRHVQKNIVQWDVQWVPKKIPKKFRCRFPAEKDIHSIEFSIE